MIWLRIDSKSYASNPSRVAGMFRNGIDITRLIHMNGRPGKLQ